MPTALQQAAARDIRAEAAYRERLQLALNAAAPNLTPAQILANVKLIARAHLRQYNQQGTVDIEAWKPVRMMRRMEAKWLQFEEGDYAMATHRSRIFPDMGASWVHVWSIRNGVHTSTPASVVRWL